MRRFEAREPHLQRLTRSGHPDWVSTLIVVTVRLRHIRFDCRAIDCLGGR